MDSASTPDSRMMASAASTIWSSLRRSAFAPGSLADSVTAAAPFLVRTNLDRFTEYDPTTIRGSDGLVAPAAVCRLHPPRPMPVRDRVVPAERGRRGQGPGVGGRAHGGRPAGCPRRLDGVDLRRGAGQGSWPARGSGGHQDADRGL